MTGTPLDLATPATIPALIRARAADSPDSPALVDGKRAISFGGLAAIVGDLVHAFRELGVARGGRILVFLEGASGIDGLVLSIAAACAGSAAILPAEPPPAWRTRMIERIKPDVVVLRDGLPSTGIAGPTVRYAPGPMLLGGGPERGSGQPRPLLREEDPDPARIALIMATSGTTGEPRLAPMPHRMILTDAASTYPITNSGSGDRILLIGAPSHTLAIWVYTALWCRAMTGVASLVSPEEIAALCLAHLPTATGATPLLLARVGDILARQVPGPTTSFRVVASAGASMTPDIRERILRGFRCPSIDEYGASESMSLSINGFLRYPGVRIADEAGAPLPPGVPGEIQARGDNVFPGYLDDPDATAAAFTDDGWFRTGDLGLIGDVGRLVVLGRLSERMNRGGVKISPMEIERAALDHPGIVGAAAYPLPHPELGQEAALAIVLAPGSELTTRQVRRWLLGRLPATHMPRAIDVLDALPRSANGKIARLELSTAGSTRAPDVEPGQG